MNMITTTKDIRTELRSVPAAKANLIREGLDEAISMCRSDDTEEHGITESMGGRDQVRADLVAHQCSTAGGGGQLRP
jgi:hypothetical protein